MEIEGKDNYDTDDAYIGEINGETYDANKFVFPKDKSVKSYSINFSTPVENTLTFTPKVKQVILKITLYTSGTTGITAITADSTKSANLYDLSGRLIAKNATADNLKGLSKGIYILNNKKYTVK